MWENDIAKTLTVSTLYVPHNRALQNEIKKIFIKNKKKTFVNAIHLTNWYKTLKITSYICANYIA